MGRPRTPIDATADAKAVRARLKDKDLEGWQRQRLQAAQLGLAKVLSLPQIAEEVGVSARTIGSWFAALRQGGIAGLLARTPKAKARRAGWTSRRRGNSKPSWTKDRGGEGRTPGAGWKRNWVKS